MKYYLAILVTVFTQIALAQTGWNWPEDSATARRKASIYPEMIESSSFDQAKEHFDWLRERAPDLNVSLYINGARLYDSLIARSANEEEKVAYGLQLLSLYDDRIRYFGKPEAVYIRKAYAGYKIFKDSREHLLPIIAAVDSAIRYNRDESPESLLLIQATLLRKAARYQLITDEDDLLQRYDKLITLASAKSDLKESTEATLYQLLNSVVKLDCARIESWLMPQLLNNPTDTSLAKRIMSLSFSAECTEEPYFATAVELLVDKAPTASLIKFLAGKKEKAGEWSEAADLYKQAYELANTNHDKTTLNIRLARIYQRTGDYGLAYNYAVRNISDPDSRATAWELIGDLWYASFQRCKGGKSIVKDRAVYLAAWEAYKKAGNSEKMNLSAQQFPSNEEIFGELMKEGEEITVDCWSSQSVTIRRRKEVTQ